MRFVSRYANYSIGITQAQTVWRNMPNGTAIPQDTDKGFTAFFEQGMLMPHEKLAALQHWGGYGNREDGTMDAFGAHGLLSGQPVNAQPFSPLDRLSVFDTARINDPELRRITEEKMLDEQFNPGDYILILPESIKPPWPSYDDMKGGPGKSVAKRIVEAAETIGVPYSEALAYESATKNRAEVVAALEEAVAKGAAEWREDQELSAVIA